jgi:hypothetical protein
MAAVSTVQSKPVASYQEVTKRSAAEWAALRGSAHGVRQHEEGATLCGGPQSRSARVPPGRRGSQMAMSSGIGPQGWLGRVPNRAERATSSVWTELRASGWPPVIGPTCRGSHHIG